MTKPKILTYALGNALWTVLYIILIGTFFYSAQIVSETHYRDIR